jgi:hypothetical protein
MKKYSNEVMEFIKEHIKGTTTRDLVTLVNTQFGTNFTESKMKSYKGNHKLTSGTMCGIPAGTPTKLYPAEVREFIKNNYDGVGHQGMADLLNKKFGTNYTKGQIKHLYNRFKLNSGKTGRFPKGHQPTNAIPKGTHLSAATEFKKGNKPRNQMPVGSEVLRTDGYVWVKISEPNKWRQKHVLLWEAANGPRPKKHVIIFGDGNQQNFDLDNLVLVSQAQLVRLNQKGLIRNNIELTKAGIIIADICNEIGKRKKKK